MTSNESSSGASPASRWPGRTLLGLALLPFLLLALFDLRAPIDLSIGDQAQYILHARSILAGRGYTDDGYIYNPRVILSPQAYPPGLPLVIAAVEGVGGPLIAARLVMIAFAVLFLYLAGRYLATFDDPVLGPASILMCAFIANLALFATGFYSDFAFAAAAWGCCLLVDRPGRWSRGRIGALSALGAIAIAFRTIGVALIPALVVHQAWRAWRHKEPWARAVVPLVFWVATYVAIDRLFPVMQGYAQQITSEGSNRAGGHGSLTLIKDLLQRGVWYREMVSEIQLVPTQWKSVNLAYHAAALVALALGSVAWVRRAGVRFLFCFVAMYAGVVLLLPWAVGRYLWPLLPVIWFATLDGARIVFQGLRIDRGRAVRASLLAAASIAFMAILLGPKAPSLVGMGDLPQGRALYAALENEATTMPVRAMSVYPRDVARLRGVSAMSVIPTTPESLLAEADSYRITHAVLGSLGVNRSADRALSAALTKYPERFQRVYGNDQFTLYRLLPVRSAGD